VLGDFLGVLGVPELTLDNNNIIDRTFYFENSSITIFVLPAEGNDVLYGFYRPRPNDQVIRLEVGSPSQVQWPLIWCGFTARLCRI
jgi:hypothetical protein